MASDEFFLTVQPESARQGLRVDRRIYEAVHQSILRNLRRYGSLTFTQLGALVEEELRETFDGSVTWYYTTVKLDLEASGEIRRVPNSRPQLIEII
jgi:uncharacterized protein DUF6958